MSNYLKARDIRDRFGVSDMTIHRWSKRDERPFPAPSLINRQRYWLEDDVDRWCDLTQHGTRPSLMPITYHPDLQCEVATIKYDFVTRRGSLVLGDGSCCDMSAAISLFATIDSGVSLIETYQGAVRDTFYKRLASTGEWVATPAAAAA